MHPNRAFAWEERDEILAFVAEQSFAHIFTASGDGLFAVHAPVVVIDGSVQFHISRRNRIASRLRGQRLLISVSGRQAYQSANWYVTGNQVPTWLYESAEVEGVARELSSDELVRQLDVLSDAHERRVQPERPWTRAKMEPGKFEAMTKAIVGFSVEPTELRGTRKFNQHKSSEDLDATIAGQVGAGRADIVAAIDEAKSRQ